jgi:hypothetical protein
MKSLVYLTFSLLSLVAALPLEDTGKESKIVPEKYIVMLKPGVKASEVSEHMVWAEQVHKRSFDVEAFALDKKGNGKGRGKKHRGVEKVWKGKVNGYSGEFDKKTITEIAENNDASTTPSSYWGDRLTSHRFCSLSQFRLSIYTERSPKAALPGDLDPFHVEPLDRPSTSTTEVLGMKPGPISLTPDSTRSTRSLKAEHSLGTMPSKILSSGTCRATELTALAQLAVEPMAWLRKRR